MTVICIHQDDMQVRI